jgi:hypothetical protein
VQQYDQAMNQLQAATSKLDLHRIQQIVKWVVYALLIVNWGFYIAEDWDRAVHTQDQSSTLFEWVREFATSIDESAWFILLFMLELETYVLEDDTLDSWVGKAIHGIRLVCFLMILHTVYAFAVAVVEIEPTVPLENATSLCDLVDEDFSYVYNLDYTEITEESCGGLSDADQFYRVGNDPVAATLDGLQLERRLAWSDLVEVIMWLVVIAAIELVVRLQERNITEGTAITIANRTKLGAYLVLFALAAWWGSLTHWLYTWDTFVWIAGFAAIEMNISEWRDEIEEELESA